MIHSIINESERTYDIPTDNRMTDCHNTIISLSTTDWEQRITAALREHHIRLTQPRRAIIHWIACQPHVFSTEALAAALAPPPTRVSRATAYRMVDYLREQGWLTRIRTERGLYAYARTLPGHYHHAICRRCGATLLIDGCAILDELNVVLARHGFRVQHHLLELTGLCWRCQAYKQ
ncbi:Fur family transcriptional regulator [Chloroflexus aggregans]|uniref:Ferric uptake regulator, Fur family n=1 Tax=Chloroflexus aggregans (strain MD-66 / DSM 9485) TaxID=326427 RepID=B8GBU5_CHLAD|nr:Fur family transcriptional regulator [Chloroflexus aggregans]ACL24912.1 ferric uptake regulator, Fur family [Chloroflexus aggregans DSM 9485]